MKKTELLNSSKLEATKDMIELAINQVPEKEQMFGKTKYVYPYYWFYRAKVIEVSSNKILKIAVFRRKELARGFRTPAYEIFISKEENRQMTYDYDNKKWRTAKIDNLDCGEDMYIYHKGKYYGINSEKIITQYLENEKNTGYEAIYQFQTNVLAENLNRAHKRITDRIDAEMELIPALPKDFDEWIINTAMIHSRYIYYSYSRKVNEGYCTHCKKVVPVTNPRHNKQGICKCCKSKITYKAIKKSAVVKDEGYASIFQRTRKGFVQRYFEIEQIYLDYKNPTIKVIEAIRVIYDSNFYDTGIYEYCEFKNTGIVRWCNWERKSWGYYSSWGKYRDIHETSLYDKNLKQVFNGTDYQYSAIDIFAKGLKGERFYPGEYLKKYKNSKYLEYMVKLKLFRIAKECIKSSYWHSDINEYGKRIHEVLRVTKDQVKMLSEMNASITELRVLQKANDAGVKMTKEQIRWIAENLGRSELINYMRYTTPHKMIRYLKEQSNHKKITNVSRDYYDYLDACEKLRYNLRNSFIMYPKKLNEAHDLAISEWQQMKERIDNMQDDERNIEMELIAEELVKKYAMKDKYFSIRIPWSCEEIKNEGHELHHCVGGYVDRVLRRETAILFIRKVDDINTPYYTMEVKGTEIIQVRGKNNSATTPEVQAFVDKFKRKILEKSLERMAG